MMNLADSSFQGVYKEDEWIFTTKSDMPELFRYIDCEMLQEKGTLIQFRGPWILFLILMNSRL